MSTWKPNTYVETHYLLCLQVYLLYLRICYNFKIKQLRRNNTSILLITVLHNSFFKLIDTNSHILYKINRLIVVGVENNSIGTKLTSNLVFYKVFPN